MARGMRGNGTLETKPPLFPEPDGEGERGVSYFLLYFSSIALILFTFG